MNSFGEEFRKENMKKETEIFLIAAQDQTLRTNSIEGKIDKLYVSPACRMCEEREDAR